MPGIGLAPSTDARLMKGVVVACGVRAVRRWLRSHAERPELPLSAGAVALLDGGPILPSSWYPYADYLELMQLVCDRVLGGSLEDMAAFAGAGAPIVYGGPHANLIRSGDPEATIREIGVLWRVCHNFGRPEAVLEHRAVVVHVSDANPMSALEGYINAGWIEGILSVAGAKEVRHELLERPWAGDRRLSMRLAWS